MSKLPDDTGLKPDILQNATDHSPILVSPEEGTKQLRLKFQSIFVNYDKDHCLYHFFISITFVLLDGQVLFRVKIDTKFPVDLYALMDLSASMQVYKDNLQNIAKKVAETIREDTDDFRFGFGGFRDKPRSPFGARNSLNMK